MLTRHLGDDVVSRCGDSPLHFAAANGRFDSLSLLLSLSSYAADPVCSNKYVCE